MPEIFESCQSRLDHEWLMPGVQDGPESDEDVYRCLVIHPLGRKNHVTAGMEAGCREMTSSRHLYAIVPKLQERETWELEDPRTAHSTPGPADALWYHEALPVSYRIYRSGLAKLLSQLSLLKVQSCAT